MPEVLITGHHAKIAAWRWEQALARTRQQRPDLLPLGLDGLVITQAQPADAGQILTLQRAAFLSEAQWNGSLDLPPLTETLPELVTALGEELVLVARLRGRVVASVRGAVRPGGRWYVGRLAVVPDLQGQGIGTRMMDVIESLAPPETEAISLVTGAGSMLNHSFFRARGYVQTERSVDDTGVPVVILERVVAGGT